MTIKKKVSVWFVSLKVLEATLCVGVKTKRPIRNPVCIREIPVKVCGVYPHRQKILGTALITRSISSKLVEAWVTYFRNIYVPQGYQRLIFLLDAIFLPRVTQLRTC